MINSKKQISLSLCIIIVLSFMIAIANAVITTVQASAENGDYKTVDLAYLDSETHWNEVRSTPAQITVLTHGYGSGDYAWSNNGGGFDFNSNSIVNQICESVGDTVNVTVLQASVKWQTSRTLILNQAKSHIIPEVSASEEGTGKNKGEQTLRGMYLTSIENRDRELSFTKHRRLTSGVLSTAEEELITASDVQGHIIVVFNAIDAEENNDIVYSELEYILDSISYEYKRLSGYLPTYNLIGHSRGGLTNMQYALSHPNNVSTIYSIGTPYDGSAFGGANDFFLELGVEKETMYEGATEYDFAPGVFDILDEEISNSYSDFWNAHYSSYYSHISFNPIGSYVTLGFALQTLIEMYVNNSTAVNLLSGAVVAVEAAVGVASIFSAGWLKSRLIGVAIDLSRDVIKKVVQEYTDDINPWLKIVNNLRTSPVPYSHIGASFSTTLVYADDLFIDLDSQLAVNYEGSNVTRKVRLMDSFDQIRGRNLKASPGEPGVAHNLEPMNKHIVGYIVDNLNLGSGTVQAFNVRYADGGCYVTGIKNMAAAVVTGEITIPETIGGYTVLGIDSLSEDIVVDSANSSILPEVKQIVIPATVKSIGEYAFIHMKGLETVTFAGNSQLEAVGAGAFANCTSLTSCQLPQSVKTLGDGVFANCSALNNFEIGLNVESIGIACFYNTAITSFIVNSENIHYIALEGVLYDFDKKAVLAYPRGKTELKYVAPITVNRIYPYAFFGNPYLEEVCLNATHSIGECAFNNCTNLETIRADKIKDVSMAAFLETAWYNNNVNNEFFGLGTILFKYNGTSEVVNIEGYTKIGSYAFVERIEEEYTTNQTVKKIIVDSVIEKIDSNAFSNCTELESLYLYDASKVSIDKSAIENLKESFKIYVPRKLYQLYSEYYSDMEVFEIISTTVEFYSGQQKVYEDTAYWGDLYEIKYTAEFSSGYNFCGWYESADLESRYVDKVFYEKVSQKQLFAKIEACESYSITYHFNDLVDGIVIRTYNVGDEIELEDDLTGLFGDFIYWCVDEECTQPVEDSHLVNRYGDIDFYAKWEYTCTYLETPVGECAGYIEANADRFPQVVYNGIMFLGWYTQPNGQGEMVANESGEILVDSLPNRVYAKWPIFNITYIYDTGTVGVTAVDNPTTYSYYDDDVELLSPSSECEKFKGWMYEGELVEKLDCSITTDIELHAMFVVEYEVVFNLGESYFMKNIADGEILQFDRYYKVGYHGAWINGDKYYEFESQIEFDNDQFAIEDDGSIRFVVEWEEHSYNYTINNPATAHTKTCSVCGVYATEDHSFRYDLGESGEHIATCTLCGHITTEAHVYSYESTSSSSHTIKCMLCNYSSTQSHTYIYCLPTATGHTQTCTKCGYSADVSHNLVYTQSNSIKHSVRCTKCGYEGYESHSFKSGLNGSKSCIKCYYTVYNGGIHPGSTDDEVVECCGDHDDEHQEQTTTELIDE